MRNGHLIAGSVAFLLGALIAVAGVENPGGGDAAAFAQQVCTTPQAVPTGDPTPTVNPQCNATSTPSTTVPNRTATFTATASPQPTNTGTAQATASAPTNTPVPPAPTQPGGGAGGAGISPPNTGSGPSGSTDGFAVALYVVAVTFMTLGAASVLVGSRRTK